MTLSEETLEQKEYRESFCKLAHGDEARRFVHESGHSRILADSCSPNDFHLSLHDLAIRYCQFLIAEPRPLLYTPPESVRWHWFPRAFQHNISPSFARQFLALSEDDQSLFMRSAATDLVFYKLVYMEPLLYAIVRRLVIREDFQVLLVSLIRRDTNMYQSIAQSNVFRVSYAYEPVTFFHAICKSSRGAESVMHRLGKLLEKEMNEQEAQDQAAMIKFLPRATNNEPRTVPRPICLPLPREQVEATFRALPELSPQLPVDLTTLSWAERNKQEQEEKEYQSHADPYIPWWRYGTIRITIDENGKQARSVYGLTAFKLCYTSSGVAPETYLHEALPNVIQRKEDDIHRLANDMSRTQLIFEKLWKIRQGPSTSVVTQLSPQEEAVLALPNNVLLLGRSGTGKTTCALLRLFARYQLFQQHQELIGADDVTEHDKLNMVFLTLSPVLCQQAQKFFDLLEHPEGKISEPGLPADRAAPKRFQEAHNRFPLFLTLRQFLRTLDASLEEPFFAHNEQAQGLTWVNEDDQGMVEILERHYAPVERAVEDLMQENANPRLFLTRQQEEKQANVAFPPGEQVVRQPRRSFEITYDYFAEHFSHFNNLGCHTSVVWTEIQSCIKGSLQALQSRQGFLSYAEYSLLLGRKGGMVPPAQRLSLYRCFKQYEAAKRVLGAFDLQDVVFYLYHRLRHEGYRGAPIHSMTLDEVQDFTQSTLQLFMSVCHQHTGFFFTGDTCQTITRGVNFRFGDLQALFHDRFGRIPAYEHKYSVPEVHQLTMNFRSHSALIQMGNSVVNILEDLFPSTIDILAKDKGTIPGPLPSFMRYLSEEDLFAFLYGHSNGLSDGVLDQFGAHQVVITRNQKTKAALPPLLQHALCLTVYEAKGLEFDDVILFDFFSDSPASSWGVIDRLQPRSCSPDESDDSGVVRVDSSSSAKQEEEQEGKPQLADYAMDYVHDTEHVLNRTTSGKDLRSLEREHMLLCSELKQLYVAVTRPRKNLYIFERDLASVEPLLRYWCKRDPAPPLVQMADMHSFVDHGIVQSTSAEEWHKQGLVMLKHQFYPQAMQCFTYAERPDLYHEAEALLKAHQAAQAEQRAFSALPEAQEGLKKEATDLYLQAAEIFLSIGNAVSAARCFTSGGEYQKGGELFYQAEQYKHAGEAYMRGKHFLQAGESLVQAKDWDRALQCFTQAHAWAQVLDILTKLPDLVDPKQKEILCQQACAHFCNLMDENNNPLPPEWPLVNRAIALLDPALASAIQTSVDTQQPASNNTFDRLCQLNLNVVKLRVLQSTTLQDPTRASNYRQLIPLCFLEVEDKVSTRREVSLTLKSEDLDEETRSECKSKLEGSLQAVMQDIQFLKERDQVFVLSFASAWKELKHLSSPLSSLQLRTLSAFGVPIRSSLCAEEDRAQCALDTFYQTAFTASPFLVDEELTPQVKETWQDVEQLFSVDSKQMRPLQHAYHLVQEMKSPGTRLPFLVRTFREQLEYPECQVRSSRYFAMSVVLMLHDASHHETQLVYDSVLRLLMMLGDWLNILQRPSALVRPEQWLSLFYLFGAPLHLELCPGFPASITLPVRSTLVRLYSLLFPQESMTTLVDHVVLPLEQTRTVLIHALSSLYLSQLSYLFFEYPKLPHARPLEQHTKDLAKALSGIVPSLSDAALGATHPLVRRPKLRAQWAFNESSLFPLPLAKERVTKMIERWHDLLYELEENDPMFKTTPFVDQSITLARYMLDQLRVPVSLDAKFTANNYLHRIHRVDNILQIVGKGVILQEWMRSDPQGRLPDFAVDMSVLHRVVLTKLKMIQLREHGYLLDSILCLNELLRFVHEQDITDIIAPLDLIADAVGCGVALFSAMFGDPCVITEGMETMLDKVTVPFVLPVDERSLMEPLLTLIQYAVPFLHSDGALAILSYNCDIPTADYDGDLLDQLWAKREDLFAYGEDENEQAHFYESLPLLTGERCPMSPDEFIATLHAFTVCNPRVVDKFVDRGRDPGPQMDEALAHSLLHTQRRARSARHIQRALASRLRKRSKPLSTKGQQLTHAYLTAQLKAGSSPVSRSLVKHFFELNTLFQKTRQYYQEACFPVSMDHVSALLSANEQLYETSVNTSLIAGGYQTTEEQWESSLGETKHALQAIADLAQAAQKKETAAVAQEGQRGTLEWRERQKAKLRKQQQGLRKQFYLEQKAERLKF